MTIPMTRWNRFILPRKWQIGLMVTLAFFLIILLGSFYIRYEVSRLRSEKNDEFAAISKLKINQITQWQQERFGDATVLSHLPFFIGMVDQWLHNKNNDYINQNIKERLAVFHQAYGYKSICLSSVSGDLLLSVGSSGHFDAFLSEKIVEAVTSKKITCTDFYYSKEGDKINYDFIAPLVDEKNRTIAVLVFRIDPAKHMYPLIQFWPTPSKTFETLLVRKEKDSIVFLSNLRFLPHSALREKIPLTETERPSVLAALGRTGMWDGKDYRDVDVVSYLSSVPATNWFIVTKIDKGEFYQELYRQTTFFILGLCLFLLILAAGFTVLYGNRQRKIIRELWKTSEELATTLHSIGDAVISTDKRGKVNYMNQVAERLTRWTTTEAKGKHISEVFKIINEETRTASENPVEAVLLKGTVVGLTNHTLLISKDGREISIADSGAPIKSKDGEIIGVVLVFKDQTEERETQKKLTSSELSYRRLFESAKDGILILDAENGMIVDVNPFLVEMLGYSKEQFISKAIWEIGFFHDIVSNRDKFLELQQKEYVKYEDLPLETVAGQKKNVEFVSNVYFAGNQKVIQCNIRDITDRRQAEDELKKKNEELKQVNAEKDKFFSIIAHDLRSPFNSLLGFTEILEKELPTMTQEQIQKIVVMMRKSATGLYSLLENLLEWSQLQRGFILFTPESILLLPKVLIDTALVKDSAIKKEIDLSYDIPEDLMVFADEKMVGCILRNLTGNAMKFTPHGGKVTITAKSIPSEWVEISVKDTGIGMSMEMIENLFQIEMNTSRKGTEREPSSGLGLILCKDFVEKHGGTLWVESEINRGSTFCFTLPNKIKADSKPVE
jgi:PAS domain S-box-containing protein